MSGAGNFFVFLWGWRKMTGADRASDPEAINRLIRADAELDRQMAAKGWQKSVFGYVGRKQRVLTSKLWWPVDMVFYLLYAAFYISGALAGCIAMVLAVFIPIVLVLRLAGGHSIAGFIPSLSEAATFIAIASAYIGGWVALYRYADARKC